MSRGTGVATEASLHASIVVCEKRSETNLWAGFPTAGTQCELRVHREITVSSNSYAYVCESEVHTSDDLLLVALLRKSSFAEECLSP